MTSAYLIQLERTLMRNRLFLFALLSISLLCVPSQAQSGEWKQLFDGKDL